MSEYLEKMIKYSDNTKLVHNLPAFKKLISYAVDLEEENEVLVAYNKELTELNNGIGEQLVLLKKELEEMKKGKKTDYVWKLRTGGSVLGVRRGE